MQHTVRKIFIVSMYGVSVSCLQVVQEVPFACALPADDIGVISDNWGGG